MFKTNVKITYAESWLPIHHKFFIHTVELLSARIALEKRYKNFISNSKNKTGTELWKHALTSMGIKTPDLAPVPKREKGKGLIIHIDTCKEFSKINVNNSKIYCC